ncbi:Cadmium, cobalt and zinc/H(+)-K(+) antiporter [Pseudobythopirellula maris]|uniref:Cadmium, cobalt and zinc/H(+)-K(+) antiporter n=1 Tax=Pseudobythopirellula maris TaxID=2527991 RepID=A0A5C5ZG68_9BACT|nr:cation diffusion facilitator family transporter [Pseudobythopirellula maris]TWT86138.1 Cadmium, cobalt and zinc/H(+)-K(+) antiporter [Pseudobythopirellula maris]
MAHSHDHGGDDYGRAFAIGVALNVAYVLVEAGYGLASGSLALLSDAGHNLSDVFGLLLAWGGHALAKIPPSSRRTYGWRGASVLAALLNALLLLAAIGAICWEAVRRFSEPAALGGTTIVVVAAVGVVINTITALLFVAGRKHDLNLRGAFLHMAADAAVSVGVVLAGLGIYATGWHWIDPTTSLVIAAVIFWSTWGLLKESANLAIQGAPEGIDIDEVRRFLNELDGVTAVHDLHVWAMSTREAALTVHLVKPQVENDDPLLEHARRGLHERFGIDHTTIQIERGEACRQSPDDTI